MTPQEYKELLDIALEKGELETDKYNELIKGI